MGIYKRNGKWEVRLQIRGVPYYRQVPEAATKEQARLAEAVLRKEVYEGVYGKDGREAGGADFAKFCATYLEQKKHSLAPVSFQNERYRVGACVAHFRGKRLKDITQIGVEGFRHRLVARLKPCSARLIVNTLSAVMGVAVENGLVGLNPCRSVKWARGSTASRRDRVLEAGEEARLFALLEGETLAAATLSLNAGLRKVSLLKLRVPDCDLSGRLLRYTAKGGGRKAVPLNGAAVSVLGGLVERAAPDGYLFRNRKGHNLSSPKGAFQRAVRGAGLGDFHFHDLRHTFSTRASRVTDAFTVRDLMGHRGVDSTDIYVTAPLEDMRRAVESLSNVREFHQRFTGERKSA